MRESWNAAKRLLVPANGIRFEVFEFGAGEKLALCLHGFPEHAISWRFQAPVLTELGYRVWMPNLRGYGATDSPITVRAYALEILVNDVASLIRASEAKQVLLIGHDWGGALAWFLAMDAPQLIDRLIVCNLPHPACFLRELKRPRQMLKSWYVLFFQIPWLPETLLLAGRARGIAQMLTKSSAPGVFDNNVLAIYRENALRPGGLTAMLNWYRGLLHDGAFRRLRARKYSKISVPTLLLWGDRDAALSVRTTDGTSEFVQHLTFRLLNGVSHWVQQEAPNEVNRSIKDWLSKHD